jgi:hypothetical protein
MHRQYFLMLRTPKLNKQKSEKRRNQSLVGLTPGFKVEGINILCDMLVFHFQNPQVLVFLQQRTFLTP